MALKMRFGKRKEAFAEERAKFGRMRGCSFPENASDGDEFKCPTCGITWTFHVEPSTGPVDGGSMGWSCSGYPCNSRRERNAALDDLLDMAW